MPRLLTAMTLSITGLLATLMVGCPASNATLVPGSDGPVTAVIGTSSTRGDAPLTVSFTGVNSTSSAGDIVSWAWNFADGTTGSGVQIEHIFDAPGRFVVILTATDSAGNTGTAAVEIRVAGSEDVTAVIQATPNTGFAPLQVTFDGTASSAVDDTILDFAWDFGDGSPISIESSPTHLYSLQGTYTVQLTVTTAGGVTATAEPVEILVGASNGASLEFSGAQQASLPTGLTDPATAFTFSAWVRVEQGGGTIARIGDFLIAANGINNTIGVGFNVATLTTNVPVLDRVWRHITVTYADGAGASIYVDGALLGSGAVAGSAIPGNLVVGQGFTGNISRVAFFPEVRPVGSIATDSRSSATPDGNNIVGYWRFRRGTGQFLFNDVNSSLVGFRGTSSDTEVIDPDWSTDTPLF